MSYGHAAEVADALTAWSRAELAAERAEATLSAVREIHEAWGRREVDDLDPLDMWESLGAALGVDECVERVRA